ncbi:hypothetical protein [Anaeromicrobium sediminis]|uniref:Uncharacterized protein n=1 Tax=Anaeromicrobium sediminis TaxID=1478221 RepID=A0A267MQ92_9FIRM|nr:hypothetical protein [Anaeromicrobium sediminis]PAB61068.1 hypothetical protein CCE28_01170 [Anaeromicrobium sediminis]
MSEGKNIDFKCRDFNLKVLKGDNFLILGTGLKKDNMRLKFIGAFKSSYEDGEFLNEEKIYHIIKSRLSKTKEI